MLVLALAFQIGQATQSCGWEYGRWVCRDVRPPQSAPLNPYPRRDPPPPLVLPPQRETDDQRYVRQAGEVLRLMNAGDCQGAHALAVVSGYPELVTLSQGLVCAPPSE